jgi:CheY-like chemotaxis protein
VNLVSNAIKFTEAGQIVITVSSQLVAQTDTYELQFTVRDTGIGIAPEAIAKLFKAFSQADSSITRQYGGTGLGLAICKQLCELMGGEISVKSTVGKGSTFSFSICAKAIAIEEIDKAITPSPKAKTALNNPDFAKLYPLKILVAEDHPVNQEILLLILEGLGYQAEAVDNGEKAVNVCLEQSYDLIFMDIQMPVMDGLTATQAIRQLSHQPWIIGLSANAFTESRESALDVGMNYYLTKPLEIQNLVAILPEIHQSQTKAQSQTKDIAIAKDDSSIDISALATLEDTIGTQNLQELLVAYLEHSGKAIAKMQAAFAKQDFVTMEAENHSLKGGSATFGAMDLHRSCQALQILCKKQMKTTEHSTEDVNKIASILKTIEEQYQYVRQAFQPK